MRAQTHTQTGLRGGLPEGLFAGEKRMPGTRTVCACARNAERHNTVQGGEKRVRCLCGACHDVLTTNDSHKDHQNHTQAKKRHFRDGRSRQGGADMLIPGRVDTALDVSNDELSAVWAGRARRSRTIHQALHAKWPK